MWIIWTVPKFVKFDRQWPFSHLSPCSKRSTTYRADCTFCSCNENNRVNQRGEKVGCAQKTIFFSIACGEVVIFSKNNTHLLMQKMHGQWQTSIFSVLQSQPSSFSTITNGFIGALLLLLCLLHKEGAKVRNKIASHSFEVFLTKNSSCSDSTLHLKMFRALDNKQTYSPSSQDEEV